MTTPYAYEYIRMNELETMSKRSSEIELEAREHSVCDRAQHMLVEIAENIRPAETFSTPHLGVGSVLNAIVLTEVGSLLQQEDHYSAAVLHLRQAMKLLDEMPLSSSLYRGITGLGWALGSFPRTILLPESSQILRDLDELLAEGLESTNNHNIDIINGIAGIVVYALARGSTEASSRTLWTTLDNAITRYFVAWKPGTYPSDKSAGNNFGLAHGPPGLLAVSAVAHSRGLLSESASAAVRSGFDLFWAQSRGTRSLPWYSTFYGDKARSRLAWCYGALGVSAAFKQAIPLDQVNSERCTSLIASSIEQYQSGDHGIRDATLCHGDAGVTLSLAYLARDTAMDAGLAIQLREATLQSAERALDAVRPDIGVGAILHSTPHGMRHSTSLLQGGVGVALAIVSAYGDTHRPWMELLGYYK